MQNRGYFVKILICDCVELIYLPSSPSFNAKALSKCKGIPKRSSRLYMILVQDGTLLKYIFKWRNAGLRRKDRPVFLLSLCGDIMQSGYLCYLHMYVVNTCQIESRILAGVRHGGWAPAGVFWQLAISTFLPGRRCVQKSEGTNCVQRAWPQACALMQNPVLSPLLSDKMSHRSLKTVVLLRKAAVFFWMQ